MRFCIVILCAFALLGCASKTPSQTIVENTRREVAAVQETVKKIELQTPKECKTELFLANLEAVNRQVSTLGGQIESIGLSCQTEKQVLEERIVARNIAIVCLLLIGVGLVFWLIKRKWSQEDVDEIKETVDAIPSTYLNKKTGGDISGASRFNAHVDFNNTVSRFKNVTLGSEVTFRNTGTTILGTTTITVEPTADNMPATKKYVDNQVTQVETAIATNATNITTLRKDVDGLGDQVSDIQATVNTLSSKDRWILNGKPENLTLTTSLQKVVMPATTRFPTTQPASMEMTEDGTGILFKKAGLIHYSRRVSLGGSNTENLYYEMRVNDTQLEPLQTQAVSVSKNTMSYTLDFYWQVTAQQTLSIWANCLEITCALNYKGVTTIIEYI